MKGCYILILSLDSATEIPLGRRGPKRFEVGYYAYVGSALGGLEARVGRHRRKHKRLRWHIDYLLTMARLESVIWAQTRQKVECQLARFLASYFPAIPHFGAGDCRCDSHLFLSHKKEDLLRTARAAFLAYGLSPEVQTHLMKKSLT